MDVSTHVLRIGTTSSVVSKPFYQQTQKEQRLVYTVTSLRNVCCQGSLEWTLFSSLLNLALLPLTNLRFFTFLSSGQIFLSLVSREKILNVRHSCKGKSGILLRDMRTRTTVRVTDCEILDNRARDNSERKSKNLASSCEEKNLRRFIPDDLSRNDFPVAMISTSGRSAYWPEVDGNAWN